jgi:hypothetical protein
VQHLKGPLVLVEGQVDKKNFFYPIPPSAPLQRVRIESYVEPLKFAIIHQRKGGIGFKKGTKVYIKT